MDGPVVANGDPAAPKTDGSQNGLSLTEYSANISPPNERPRPKALVPEAFLAPDGYPDVCSLSDGDCALDCTPAD
jgi:hypothetical protein